MAIDLTEPELHALTNLGHKARGEAVPFVNIAHARKLTDLGFAQRSREGWDITAEGAAFLARLAPPHIQDNDG